MFEKEAEEYNQKVPFNPLNVEKEIRRAFQKGAEFGYNKAKEEMQKNGLALQSDMDKTIEQNISLKEQIEKMKCCHNCKHFAYSRCELRQLGFSCLCNSFYKLEIKEND